MLSLENAHSRPLQQACGQKSEHLSEGMGQGRGKRGERREGQEKKGQIKHHKHEEAQASAAQRHSGLRPLSVHFTVVLRESPQASHTTAILQFPWDKTTQGRGKVFLHLFPSRASFREVFDAEETLPMTWPTLPFYKQTN